MSRSAAQAALYVATILASVLSLSAGAAGNAGWALAAFGMLVFMSGCWLMVSERD